MRTIKPKTLLLPAIILVLAASCAGNRQLDGSKSPFVEEELPVLKENMVRAEGTGTSPDVQMATEIARIKAAKAAPADTLTETAPDGSIRTVEKVSTPLFDVTEIDRRVFRNRTTDDFTVWILLEAEILP